MLVKVRPVGVLTLDDGRGDAVVVVVVVVVVEPESLKSMLVLDATGKGL